MYHQLNTSCNTLPLLQTTPILSESLPISEITCVTQQVLLEGDTEYLTTFYSEELSLEKAKLDPSSSPFGVPVSTLQTLIVTSFLLETNVFTSTNLSLVFLPHRTPEKSSDLVPVLNLNMIYIKHEDRGST